NDYVNDVDVMLSLFASEEDLESIDGDKDFEMKCEEGYVGQMSSDEYKNELVTDHKVFTDEVVDNVGQSKKSEKKPSEEFSQRESSMKYKRLADISNKGKSVIEFTSISEKDLERFQKCENRESCMRWASSFV
ncbi:hypothetical protein Tco_0352153, partial [Tanacetum coccineum]